jgi:CBS domain containing-hemolysin-like protein
MRGTIWINCGIGLIAFFITLGTALLGNVWLVSLERALYAFLFFFLLAFPVRWLVARITETPLRKTAQESQSHADSLSDTVEELTNPSETEPSEEFTPLFPARIEGVNPQQDPAAIAGVIRRLTDE